MVIYDLVHGYQPFMPPNFVPDWVEYNVQQVFLPNSIAMKNGSVKRGVQLQGWTIENFLKSPNPIKPLAEEMLDNLKQAVQNGGIEIGTSSYSHVILPFFIKEIVQLQIIFDVEVLRKHVGEPTWFWFPEGAVNQYSLEILFDLYPGLIVVIPDTTLSKTNYSDFIKIKYPGGKKQKAVVCNSLLKDVMMNASYYSQKPSYVPDYVTWPDAQNMIHNGSDFKKVLQQLGGDSHVLARDWENKGSVDGLADFEPGGKEVKGLLDLQAEFKLVSEVNWSECETVNIDEIKDASWECDTPQDNPYPYWKPNKDGVDWKKASEESKMWASKWEDMVDDYNNKFKTVVDKNGGVKNIIKDDNLTTKIKGSFSALISCIPWHFLAKDEYSPDPGFSKEAWEKIVVPSINILEELV